MSTALATAPARAVDIPEIGGETLTLDISNTTELNYRFNNRNDTQGASGGTTLNPNQLLDDDYGEWLNRLYLRAFYWKFSLGVRLDSAVFFDTPSREGTRALISERLGSPDLALENRFARELHSRYTSLIYPAKLNLGFKHKRTEVTVGDFYAQLGRGLAFSVRKVDELGVDTTVRGIKLQSGYKFDGGFRLEGTLFGGQMNPVRIDLPTGRILHGTDNPLFFGFPKAGQFQFYEAVGPEQYELRTERPRPSYIEDTVVGGNVTLGPQEIQFEGNAVALFRGSDSEGQQRCIEAVTAALSAGLPTDRSVDDCRADFPAFGSPEASRSHDQLVNFGGAIRVPQIADLVDGYVEVVGQHQTQGAVTTINPDGSVSREEDLWGYGIYANVNFIFGPISATLEGKHYRSFSPLGANIDLVSAGFSAPEFSIAQYSVVPTAESIYIQFIGSPNVCNTGGRLRLDGSVSDDFRVYMWGGRYTSFTEADPNNINCDTNDPLRTDTWDGAAGMDMTLQEGKSHYVVWIGGRSQNHPVDVIPNQFGPNDVFYREGYIRYDMVQHIAGDFSLSAAGFHQKRYEPALLDNPWNEGENYLALNWNPHFSFIWGVEYQTRPGIPFYYNSGGIQYRSKDRETWYGQLTDQVRVFLGQRRSALRCIGGVCRIYPAFEGFKFELSSRF